MSHNDGGGMQMSENRIQRVGGHLVGLDTIANSRDGNPEFERDLNERCECVLIENRPEKKKTEPPLQGKGSAGQICAPHARHASSSLHSSPC